MKRSTLRISAAMLISTALMTAVSAHAAAASAPQSKKDLVARVIQLQQGAITNIADTIAGQTARQLLQAAGPAVMQLPADKRDAAGKEVQAQVKHFYDDVDGLLKDRATKLAPSTIGPVLEEKFSDEELKQMVTWLESPAAKKLDELGGTMMGGLEQKLITDTRPTVEPKIQALQAQLRKTLGLPATDAASSGKAPAAKKTSPATKK